MTHVTPESLWLDNLLRGGEKRDQDQAVKFKFETPGQSGDTGVTSVTRRPRKGAPGRRALGSWREREASVLLWDLPRPSPNPPVKSFTHPGTRLRGQLDRRLALPSGACVSVGPSGRAPTPLQDSGFLQGRPERRAPQPGHDVGAGERLPSAARTPFGGGTLRTEAPGWTERTCGVCGLPRPS